MVETGRLARAKSDQLTVLLGSDRDRLIASQLQRLGSALVAPLMMNRLPVMGLLCPLNVDSSSSSSMNGDSSVSLVVGSSLSPSLSC